MDEPSSGEKAKLVTGTKDVEDTDHTYHLRERPATKLSDEGSRDCAESVSSSGFLRETRKVRESLDSCEHPYMREYSNSSFPSLDESSHSIERDNEPGLSLPSDWLQSLFESNQVSDSQKIMENTERDDAFLSKTPDDQSSVRSKGRSGSESADSIPDTTQEKKREEDTSSPDMEVDVSERYKSAERKDGPQSDDSVGDIVTPQQKGEEDTSSPDMEVDVSERYKSAERKDGPQSDDSVGDIVTPQQKGEEDTSSPDMEVDVSERYKSAERKDGPQSDDSVGDIVTPQQKGEEDTSSPDMEKDVSVRYKSAEQKDGPQSGDSVSDIITPQQKNEAPITSKRRHGRPRKSGSSQNLNKERLSQNKDSVTPRRGRDRPRKSSSSKDRNEERLSQDKVTIVRIQKAKRQHEDLSSAKKLLSKGHSTAVVNLQTSRNNAFKCVPCYIPLRQCSHLSYYSASRTSVVRIPNTTSESDPRCSPCYVSLKRLSIQPSSFNSLPRSSKVRDTVTPRRGRGRRRKSSSPSYPNEERNKEKAPQSIGRKRVRNSGYTSESDTTTKIDSVPRSGQDLNYEPSSDDMDVSAGITDYKVRRRLTDEVKTLDKISSSSSRSDSNSSEQTRTSDSVPSSGPDLNYEPSSDYTDVSAGRTVSTSSSGSDLDFEVSSNEDVYFRLEECKQARKKLRRVSRKPYLKNSIDSDSSHVSSSSNVNSTSSSSSDAELLKSLGATHRINPCMVICHKMSVDTIRRHL